MKDEEVMSFRDAVHQWVIEIYDEQCKEVLVNTMKGKYDHFQFSEFSSIVIGTFLNELYTEKRERFIELVEPIYEEYCRNKMEQDAYTRREHIRMSNVISLGNQNPMN